MERIEREVERFLNVMAEKGYDGLFTGNHGATPRTMTLDGHMAHHTSKGTLSPVQGFELTGTIAEIGTNGHIEANLWISRDGNGFKVSSMELLHFDGSRRQSLLAMNFFTPRDIPDRKVAVLRAVQQSERVRGIVNQMKVLCHEFAEKGYGGPMAFRGEQLAYPLEQLPGHLGDRLAEWNMPRVFPVELVMQRHLAGEGSEVSTIMVNRNASNDLELVYLSMVQMDSEGSVTNYAHVDLKKGMHLPPRVEVMPDPITLAAERRKGKGI